MKSSEATGPLARRFFNRGGGWVDFGGVSYYTPTNRTLLRQDLVNVTAVDINIASLLHNYAVDNIHVTYAPAAPPPTSVPEPGTIGLVGLGVLGMVRRVRRPAQRMSRRLTIGRHRLVAGPRP